MGNEASRPASSRCMMVEPSRYPIVARRWKALVASLETLWASSYEDDDDDPSSRPSLDRLPDEVLLMVLDQLADQVLLPLRLVSKRCESLVIDVLLRRGRRATLAAAPSRKASEVEPAEPAWLQVHPAVLFHAQRDTETRPAILRELEALRVPVPYARPTLRALALAEGKCQVRSLSSTPLEVEDGSLLVQVLQKQRLRQVHFQPFFCGKRDREVYKDCLKALDASPALESLSLVARSYSLHSTAFTFKALGSLKRLHVGQDVSVASATSLLRTSRKTLQSACLEVRGAGLAKAAARCAQLRRLALMACPDLDVLRALPRLEKLTVRCEKDQDLAWLRQFLDRGHLAAELHVYLMLMPPRRVPANLQVALDSCGQQVRGLEVKIIWTDRLDAGSFDADAVVDYLSCLPELRVLTVDDHMPKIEWSDVVDRWTPLCVPSLERLEVEEKFLGPWVDRLKARYPDLKVDRPNRCWHELCGSP